MIPVHTSGLMTSLKTRLDREKSLCVPDHICLFSVKALKLQAVSCLLTDRAQVLLFPSCVNYTPGFDRCHIRHRMLSLFLFFLSHVADNCYAGLPELARRRRLVKPYVLYVVECCQLHRSSFSTSVQVTADINSKSSAA